MASMVSGMTMSTTGGAPSLRKISVRISYWEGAIDVTGTRSGAPVTGRGYLEMTGYRGSLGRVLSGR